MAVFNIYCDESSVENTDLRFMVIGSLFLPRNKKKEKLRKIRELLAKNVAFNEIKWSKITKKNLKAAKAVVNHVLKDDDCCFRFILVDKTKIKLRKFHEDDEELAFFKFYYLMLRNRLLDGNTYYIFLDKKNTRQKNRIQALGSFLKAYIYTHRQNCSIKHIQAYPSSENIFIQVIDLLTGALAHQRNHKTKKGPKFEVLSLVKKLASNEGLQSTPLKEKKFNIFEWIPFKS